MINFIQKQADKKVIAIAAKKKDEKCLNIIKNKIPFLFDRFCKHYPLNMKQKTTGRIETENRHLKYFGADLRSSLTKLAKTDVTKNRTKEHNNIIEKERINKTILKLNEVLDVEVLNHLAVKLSK